MSCHVALCSTNAYTLGVVDMFRKIFNMLWAVVRKWVDPSTLDFIVKLNSAEESLRIWKEHGIPQEAIPVSMGGKSKGIPIIDLARMIAPK